MSENDDNKKESLTYKIATNIPFVGPVIKSVNETCNPNIDHGVTPPSPPPTSPTIYELAKARRNEKIEIRAEAIEFMEEELRNKRMQRGDVESEETDGERRERREKRREDVEELLMRVVESGGGSEKKVKIKGILKIVLGEEIERLEQEKVEGEALGKAVEELPQGGEEGGK